MSTLKGMRHAPPRASAMIEALRGLGYNASTALADIIDNSVAACASSVWVDLVWDEGSSRITILDDGRGMSAFELDKAMRLGERSPLDERGKDDLGRFGLGLKTASFSQCRSLTVATIACDGLQCLRWDLDKLGNDGDSWYLLEGPALGSEQFLTPLISAGKGTIVVLEKLDRIVAPGYTVQNFLDLSDRIEQHLAMVFHRYLEGARPRLKLRLNGRLIRPWDPFMSGHPSKPWVSPVARAPGFPGVTVECHVLPHKDRLSEKEYLAAQGPDGWTSQQGFYVYRKERLLVAGSWLGLGQGRLWTKDEAHRLARIRLDIPNHADAEWKIDIRKSSARPPTALRPWLVRLAEETRQRARHAFAHRGRNRQTPGGQEIKQAWRVDHNTNGIRYRIDNDHPAIRAVLDHAGPLLAEVKAMIRIIEETVPVQRIWLDTAENRDTPRTGFESTPSEEIMIVLESLYHSMVKASGMSPALACESILCTEPFNNYPELVRSLPERLEQKATKATSI